MMIVEMGLYQVIGAMLLVTSTVIGLFERKSERRHTSIQLGFWAPFVVTLVVLLIFTVIVVGVSGVVLGVEWLISSH